MQSGLSATQGLYAYRGSGGHIGNQSWYRLWGELQAIQARVGQEFGAQQNLRPTANEIQTWTTSKARGYVQQVEIIAREKATGTLISIPYTSISSTLRSRESVVREALDVYSDDNAAKYNQAILTGIYTGTYQAAPNEE